MTKAMTAAPRKDRDIPGTARAGSAARVRCRVFMTCDVPAGIGERLTSAGLIVMPFESAALHTALAEEGHCAVLWADPAVRLAEALEQGADPAEAIGNWLNEAQSVLTAFRRNRRRLTLIEAQSLTTELAEPERALLRDRLACPKLPLPLGDGAEGSTVQDTDPSLAAMVAAAVVPRVAEIQDSLSELQGSGISPLQSELPVAALATMAASFNGWQAKAAGQAEELELLRAELTLLQQQSETSRAELAQLQQDLIKKDMALSEAIAKEQTRDKAMTQAASDRKAAEAALTEAAADMAAEREASTRELELLRAELALLQKKFEATRTELAQRQQDLDKKDRALSKAIAKGQARDKAVIQAAAELTAERDTAASERKAAEAALAEAAAEMAAERETSAQELALLRDQIALQQQEFDNTLAEKDAVLAETIATGEARDKAVIQAAAEMAAEREASARELSLLRDQIALQQQEFDSTLAELRAEAAARRTVEYQRDLLLGSTSWRVTRPIRVIKTIISGGSKPVDMQIAEERALLPKP